MERPYVLLAVADRAFEAITNGGEHAPDLRWADQYINEACVRYHVTLSDAERAQVKRNLEGRK